MSRSRRWRLTLAAIAVVASVILLLLLAARPGPATPGEVAARPSAPAHVAHGVASDRPATPAATRHPPGASPDLRTRDSAQDLLDGLTTAEERSAGYSRGLFHLWTDQDGDGCDTRDEVLIAESTTPVVIGRGCSLSDGTWVSAYDGVTTSDPSTFDIDHVVPLREAWDSGAYGWDATRREDYANDLGDGRSLRAVSAHSNRSKGDKDPAQWLPPSDAFLCTYLEEWIVVKVRWDLSVDPAERAALTDGLDDCPGDTLSVTRQ